jgi:hypothetical protein
MFPSNLLPPFSDPKIQVAVSSKHSPNYMSHPRGLCNLGTAARTLDSAWCLVVHLIFEIGDHRQGHK